jgi:hypothetical protein
MDLVAAQRSIAAPPHRGIFAGKHIRFQGNPNGFTAEMTRVLELSAFFDEGGDFVCELDRVLLLDATFDNSDVEQLTLTPTVDRTLEPNNLGALALSRG